MSKPAIRIENLGKRYIVDHEQKARGGYRTLRDSLAEMAAAPVKKLMGLGAWNSNLGKEGREKGRTKEEFWALKDITFEVQPGEVMGIIGRNGAGKSTLLKVLSQITKPTTGRVELNGRVGSLLEVGTGFHPELTGRENIYLNGSILGMNKREIDRKFDEIVDFAEIEQFLDTPVKRYSSGMYVRLAFAVASHLEPEVMIVDEVLAVGDYRFQQKCIDRISLLSNQGLTILFVTHQLATLQRLCNCAIFLEGGRLRHSGDKEGAIRLYLDDAKLATPGEWQSIRRSPAARINSEATFSAIYMKSSSPLPNGNPIPDCSVDFSIRVEATTSISSVRLALSIFSHDGAKLINMDSLGTEQIVPVRAGDNTFNIGVKSLHLKPGTYNVALWLACSGHVIDYVPNAFSVEVEDFSPLSKNKFLGVGDGCVTSDYSFTWQEITNNGDIS